MFGIKSIYFRSHTVRVKSLVGLFSTVPSNEVFVPKQLNVYGNIRSQPSRSVLFLLNETKIQHVFHQLNNRDGEHRKAEYKSIIPTQLLPSILTADGMTLGEGAAILQYLVDRYDLKDWTSTDVNERAQINFWLHWNHTNTRNGTMKVLVPEILFPPKENVASILEKGQKAVARHCKFISKHLESQGTKFLVSNKPTIADLMILPELDQLSKDGYRLFDYSPYPRIEQYIADMRAALPTYDDNFRPVAEKGAELAAQRSK